MVAASEPAGQVEERVRNGKKHLFHLCQTSLRLPPSLPFFLSLSVEFSLCQYKEKEAVSEPI